MYIYKRKGHEYFNRLLFFNTLKVPQVLPEVTIPREITPDNVNTVIVDSSSRPEDRAILETEIRASNVIALIYAVNDDKSFSRLGTHWLPYIRSLGVNVPVIIVGNKIDVRGTDMNNPRLEEMILPLMNDFKEVETCVECSALELVNIAEVFYFAQKAVLHPTAPLYDSREHVLKGPCEAALERIFRLCDGNKDGLLDDEELNTFQTICFETPLQKAELEGVKSVIVQGCPEGLTGDSVNLDGFLFLQRLFIQRGRLETTWTVLRRFGYEDDLSLREDYLHPVIFDLSQQSVELSPKGYQFLTELFAKFDRDGDGALAWDELDELFATCPGNPWTSSGFPETTLLNDTGALTLQGFLAQWVMTTLLEPSLALAYLAHLGYGELTGQPPLSALKTIKIRRRNDPALAQRDVFLCHVLGAVGCGKSALLRSFLHRPFAPNYTPTTRPALAVNSVEIGGRDRFLVLKEIGPFGGRDLELLQNESEALRADVYCLLYDASDANSFGYIAGLLAQFADVLSLRPVLLVATKSDCDLVPQRGPIQPDQFCRDQGLEPPFSINLGAARTPDLFAHLLTQALHPSNFILPPGAKERAKQAKRLVWSLGIGAGTVAVSAAIAIIAFKLFKPKP